MKLLWRSVAIALPIVLLSASARSLASSRFAAPEIIVMHGGPLAKRVVLADFAENQRLMLATTERVRVEGASLRDRPRIRLAMYWGTAWRGKLDLPDSVGVNVLDGAQAGAFYPMFQGQQALWLFGPYDAMPASLRSVAPEGLAILARSGIPITVK